ncbi:MAG: hypothetical protein EA401_06070 [Planctomycetota bacterium]|nr:MAG: hypothetical protein EA401_06070 [Planctomycetota bacterium]
MLNQIEAQTRIAVAMHQLGLPHNLQRPNGRCAPLDNGFTWLDDGSVAFDPVVFHDGQTLRLALHYALVSRTWYNAAHPVLKDDYRIAWGACLAAAARALYRNDPQGMERLSKCLASTPAYAGLSLLRLSLVTQEPGWANTTPPPIHDLYCRFWNLTEPLGLLEFFNELQALVPAHGITLPAAIPDHRPLFWQALGNAATMTLGYDYNGRYTEPTQEQVNHPKRITVVDNPHLTQIFKDIECSILSSGALSGHHRAMPFSKHDIAIYLDVSDSFLCALPSLLKPLSSCFPESIIYTFDHAVRVATRLNLSMGIINGGGQKRLIPALKHWLDSSSPYAIFISDDEDQDPECLCLPPGRELSVLHVQAGGRSIFRGPLSRILGARHWIIEVCIL